MEHFDTTKIRYISWVKPPFQVVVMINTIEDAAGIATEIDDLVLLSRVYGLERVADLLEEARNQALRSSDRLEPSYAVVGRFGPTISFTWEQCL